jgi:hypothetical protein
MILDGDAAYLGEALVDVQVAAIRRKNGKADRRRIIDQTQGRLLWNRHADGRRRLRGSYPILYAR